MTLTDPPGARTLSAMQQPRTPEETFAIVERIGERGAAIVLHDLEEGDRFTLHPKGCLQHVVGVCTCEPIVSEPLAEV